MLLGKTKLFTFISMKRGSQSCSKLRLRQAEKCGIDRDCALAHEPRQPDPKTTT